MYCSSCSCAEARKQMQKRSGNKATLLFPVLKRETLSKLGSLTIYKHKGSFKCIWSISLYNLQDTLQSANNHVTAHHNRKVNTGKRDRHLMIHSSSCTRHDIQSCKQNHAWHSHHTAIGELVGSTGWKNSIQSAVIPHGHRKTLACLVGMALGRKNVYFHDYLP